MRFVGFIGPSYTLRSVNVDCQRCINLYPEINEIGSGKEREIAALVGTPGLSLLATLGAGPIRGLYTASNGRLFAVSANTLYEIDSDWNSTARGTLTTYSGQVSMADNGVRLAIVDGTEFGYMFNFATSAYAAITFPTDIGFSPFTGADFVVYQDGYFIFNQSGTGNFFISGLVNSIVADDTTISATDYKASEGNPDNVIAILSDHRDLWIFNNQTIEVFYNSGDTFPFQQVQGAFVENGLAAKFSIAKMNGTVFWVGKDDKGHGIIYMAKGYQPQRISTHAVEYAIQGYGDISDAVAFCYQEAGHHFYVVNFPSANTTWAFDTTTSLWHERVYTNQGVFERHRANCHAFAFSTHVVGDYENGKIYKLSSSIYSDDGSEITRRRVSPHLTQSLDRLFYSKFQLDLEAGAGIDGLGQGIDPQVMLQYSDDGGHTWSSEKWQAMGKIGETKWRPIWRRLGSSRDRVFRVTITDPVKVVLIGAEVDAVAGRS